MYLLPQFNLTSSLSFSFFENYDERQSDLVCCSVNLVICNTHLQTVLKRNSAKNAWTRHSVRVQAILVAIECIVTAVFVCFQTNMTLLDDDSMTVEQAGIEDTMQLLIEGNICCTNYLIYGL